MYKHACHSIDAPYYLVIDMDTGKMIKGVVWADDDTGMYGRARWENEDQDCHPTLRHPIMDEFGNVKVFVETGNVRIVHKDTWDIVHDLPWDERTKQIVIRETGGRRVSQEDWLVRWR